MACLAPVFEPNRNIIVCLLLALIYLFVILFLIVATLGLCLFFDSCRCLIKQYQFRIGHCREGNSNPMLAI